MSLSTATSQPSPVGQPWRAAAASAIGSVLEYYDFFVYGPLAALVFPALFFPHAASGLALLLSLGTYAVGFVARPVGGVLVGHFGDRIGRRNLLVATFLVTGCVTAAMGLLPTYAQAGVWAPVMLVVLRLVQGIALGGEWGGASLLAVEHAPRERRGFFGSLVQAGAPVGVIASSGLVAILTGELAHHQILAWGWRVPFLLSVILVVTGLILRLKITESPEFTEIRARGEQARTPAWDALRHYPGRILAAIGIHVGDTTLGFMQGVFVLGFATKVLHFSPTLVLLATIASSLANLAWTPVAGHFADRYGPRVTVAIGAVALGGFAFPMFWLLNTRSVPALFMSMALGGLIVATLFAPQPVLFASWFPTPVRYSAVSIGFQVATVIGGGFGPIIAQALQNGAHGATWPVSTYLMVVAAAALVAAVAVRPVRRHRPSPAVPSAPLSGAEAIEA